MKITYKTNVLDVIRLVENNTPALWEKEWNNLKESGNLERQVTYNLIKISYIIDNMLIYNRLLIAKRGNISMIHIIVCEDSDMFI